MWCHRATSATPPGASDSTPRGADTMIFPPARAEYIRVFADVRARTALVCRLRARTFREATVVAKVESEPI